ncbi:MAG: hypothetical protein IH595_02665 [Bacteroidales bacterium]|nr:hypothetical protein [Bacteroidales bacterium]
MKYIISILSVVILIGFTSCNSSSNKQAKEQATTEISQAPAAAQAQSNYQNQGTVEKVLQTSGYTYALIKSGADTVWVAVNKMDLKDGETLYYNGGLEMNNFRSKELNRTFTKVFLVQDASTDSSSKVTASGTMGEQPMKPKIEQEQINVKPMKGSITIAELYNNKEKYSGKVVKVRGKVTKYNPDIMGKNWVHIQDGTKSGSNFDLTITTPDQVRMGDIVSFEGKITLNKDFGAGYFYPVIMEEGKVLK